MQASAARSSRLYASKGSSSGNLGGGGLGAEPSRGSTPPTPGKLILMQIRMNLLLEMIEFSHGIVRIRTYSSYETQ